MSHYGVSAYNRRGPGNASFRVWDIEAIGGDLAIHNPKVMSLITVVNLINGGDTVSLLTGQVDGDPQLTRLTLRIITLAGGVEDVEAVDEELNVVELSQVLAHGIVQVQ